MLKSAAAAGKDMLGAGAQGPKNTSGLSRAKYLLLLCVLSVVCATLLLSGCSSTSGSKPVSNGKITVYTSFYAMYDFTKTIAGDKANVEILVPPGTEPHDWEPSASDIVSLENADLFVYNGAGLEYFVDSFKDSVENKNLTYVEASKGVSLLNNEDGQSTDPHVWLDPQRAKQEMRTIADALAKKDPRNKTYYEANYEAEAMKLDTLDTQYKKAVAGFSKKDLVVSHEAYAYLCAAYGLDEIAISGLDPEGEPTPSQMNKIAKYVKSREVTTVFTEEMVSPKAADTIARETGAKTEVLSPFESGTTSYVTVMEENLKKLTLALR